MNKKLIYFYIITILILTKIQVIEANCKNKCNDKIIAVVNNKIILESDLQKHINIFFLLSKSNKKKISRNNLNLRKDILNDIIINKIQLEVAKKNKIKINKSRVEDVLYDYSKKENMTLNNYINFINSKNILFETFDKFIEESLTIGRLQRNITDLDVFASKSDIKKYTNSYKHISKIGKIKYDIIYISINNFNKKGIDKKIKNILKLLSKTKNIDNIKKKIKIGNNLSCRIIKNKSFKNTYSLKKINKKVMVGPIYFNKKLLFMKILKQKFIINENVGSIQLEHFTIREKNKTFQKKINNKKNLLISIRNKILNEKILNKRIKIKNFIKNENVSKNNVSNIFYENISELHKGDLSKPFKSEIGWHIVKVNNKNYREMNIDQAFMLEKIKKDIISKKNKNIKKMWLKSLRNESIISLF